MASLYRCLYLLRRNSLQHGVHMAHVIKNCIELHNIPRLTLTASILNYPSVTTNVAMPVEICQQSSLSVISVTSFLCAYTAADVHVCKRYWLGCNTPFEPRSLENRTSVGQVICGRRQLHACHTQMVCRVGRCRRFPCNASNILLDLTLKLTVGLFHRSRFHMQRRECLRCVLSL